MCMKMGAYGSKRFREDIEALKSNDPTLQSLNYERGGLGDEGARALAEALRSNRTLRRLQLGHCGLTAVGLRTLVRALGDTSITPCHLRRLDLVSGLWAYERGCCSSQASLIAEYELRPPSGQRRRGQRRQMSGLCEFSPSHSATE